MFPSDIAVHDNVLVIDGIGQSIWFVGSDRDFQIRLVYSSGWIYINRAENSIHAAIHSIFSTDNNRDRTLYHVFVLDPIAVRCGPTAGRAQ